MQLEDPVSVSYRLARFPSGFDGVYYPPVGQVTLVTNVDPAKIGSVYSSFSRLKKMADLGAVCVELDSRLQPVLDEAWAARRQVGVGDVGFYAVLVNYGLERGVPSFALKDVSLPERTEFAASRLSEIVDMHERAVFVCSERYARLLETHF